MGIDRPELKRVWAAGADASVIEDPSVTTLGKFDVGFGAEKPAFENINFIYQILTKSFAYLEEQGLAVWSTGTTYPATAIVKGSDGRLYQNGSESTGDDPALGEGTWADYLNTILSSPSFSGAPEAPTAELNNNSLILANTKFVGDEIANKIQPLATLLNPVFLGAPKAPQAALGSDNTNVANAAFVVAEIIDRIKDLAPKDSPTFLNNPTAPTQAAGDNSTRLSNTSFVGAAVATGISGLAALSAPDFTDNPTANTQLKTDNSTRLANTAHVKDVLADYAKLSGANLTNNPTASSQSAGNNTTRIANTAFVAAVKAILEAATALVQSNLTSSINSQNSTNTSLTNSINGKSPTSHGHAASISVAGLRKLNSALLTHPTNGYFIERELGLKIQWGKVGATVAHTAVTVTLPVANDNYTFIAIASGAENNVVDDGTRNAYVLSKTQIKVVNTTAGTVDGMNWLVVGK